MARSSGVAVMVLLVGLLLFAQSMTAVFAIRGLGEIMPKRNSTSALEVNNNTDKTTTSADVEQERNSKVEPEVVRTVEESTADATVSFSPERVQMEQSGWSCSGGFTNQQHAWYCAGRSVY